MNAVDELLSFERHPALAVEDIYRLIVTRPSSLVYFRILRSDMSEGATNVSTRLKNVPPTPQLSQNECKQHGFISPQAM